MRLILATACAAVLLFGAAAPGQAANTQQDRMSACNASAGSKNLSGDARKSFMSSCLAGNGSKSTAAATAVPSSKAAGCNAQADSKHLSGAARTSFVKKCAAG